VSNEASLVELEVVGVIVALEVIERLIDVDLRGDDRLALVKAW